MIKELTPAMEERTRRYVEKYKNVKPIHYPPMRPINKFVSNAADCAAEWPAYFKGETTERPYIRLSFFIHPVDSKAIGFMPESFEDFATKKKDISMPEGLFKFYEVMTRLVDNLEKVLDSISVTEEENELSKSQIADLRAAFAEVRVETSKEEIDQPALDKAVRRLAALFMPLSERFKAAEECMKEKPNSKEDAMLSILSEANETIGEVLRRAKELGEGQEIVLARLNRVHERMDTFQTKRKFAKNLGNEERRIAFELWKRCRYKVAASKNVTSKEDVYNAPLCRRRLNALGINSAEEFENAIDAYRKYLEGIGQDTADD